MKRLFHLSIYLLASSLLWAQETKIIEIQKAGSSQQDEALFPGATILLRDRTQRVHLFHEGGLVVSDRAYFYAKRNFFKAQGSGRFYPRRQSKNDLPIHGIRRRRLAKPKPGEMWCSNVPT